MALGDGIRRNVATISQEERNSLRHAITALNRDPRFVYPGQRNDLVRDANGKIVHGAGGVTYWFKQDEIHQATHVHGGPAFLTWHRELCNRFEALLRGVDPQVSLHYWDWTTDPVGLFTSDFMGEAHGEAGEPWLSAGFYNPTANPFRSDNDFSTTDNPFDPPRTLERQVAGGIPNLGVSDAQIITAETFPQMRQLLESAHNVSHGYIGGTLGDAHRSFRDPFVFLLHSNVDRLFALWQLQPGKAWRLDPEQVYGSESDTVADNPFPRDVGILTPMEPWAGVNAPGAESGVQLVRPWADPENWQLLPQNQKKSKDPSVVAPPRYDTNPKHKHGTGGGDVAADWLEPVLYVMMS